MSSKAQTACTEIRSDKSRQGTMSSVLAKIAVVMAEPVRGVSCSTSIRYL